MRLEEVYQDMAAFADDDEDVVVDPEGSILFVRGGQEIACQLVVGAEGSGLIRVDGVNIPYRKFITHNLGKLDVLAQRLIEKRPRVEPFIDGPARVERAAGEVHDGSALALLQAECVDPSPFATRVAFITADAGHGKTALLREFQARQAEKFLAGQTSTLFWHVDLQGRQLLRLSEALMGDLGDLRLPGLWMPGIIRLLRHHGLILAIDGFDELAAEQGGADAIGALATLVDQLEGTGVIVAASRRTFFDTEDYLRRAGVFKRAIANPCQFDQLALFPWRKEDAVEFLTRVEFAGNKFSQPETTYREIASELGGDTSHPVLTRPFLLNQVAKGLLTYQTGAADFLRLVDDPLGGVGTIVQGFIEREVSEKWRYADTGEPYLTADQHVEFLSATAEEMYRSQKDRLSVDIIETLATLLLDSWNVDPSRRQQVIEMVRMHVLLVIPPDGDASARAFDHPEFRDYFIAHSLKGHLALILEGGGTDELARFLSIAQLSDSTAQYVCAMLPIDEPAARELLAGLSSIVAAEWKPTFLQINVGTLFPYVVNGIEFEAPCEFDATAIYSSLVFEGTRLSQLTIARGSFVNASFRQVDWRDVRFTECELGELSLDDESTYSGVTFDNCHVSGIRVFHEGEEIAREYSPERIEWQLGKLGIALGKPEQADARADAIEQLEESDWYKLVHRVLRMFHRTTILNDQQLEIRFRQDHAQVLDEIIPLLERYEIVERRPWRGSGNQRLWVIRQRIDDVFAAEGGHGPANLTEFWVEVRSRR